MNRAVRKLQEALGPHKGTHNNGTHKTFHFSPDPEVFPFPNKAHFFESEKGFAPGPHADDVLPPNVIVQYKQPIDPFMSTDSWEGATRKLEDVCSTNVAKHEQLMVNIIGEGAETAAGKEIKEKLYTIDEEWYQELKFDSTSPPHQSLEDWRNSPDVKVNLDSRHALYMEYIGKREAASNGQGGSFGYHAQLKLCTLELTNFTQQLAQAKQWRSLR